MPKQRIAATPKRFDFSAAAVFELVVSVIYAGGIMPAVRDGALALSAQALPCLKLWQWVNWVATLFVPTTNPNLKVKVRAR